MRRGRYWLAFGLLLLVEVLIAQYVHDRFVRPYLGDVLVILLLYCLGRGIGIRSRWLAFGVTLLGAAAELLQALGCADRLGLAEDSVLRVILGSTFDWADLACYLVGGLLLLAWEQGIRREQKTGAVK